MSFLKKVISRVRGGALRDIWRESRWIYRHTRAYRSAVLAYILLGLLSTGLGIASALVSK